LKVIFILLAYRQGNKDIGKICKKKKNRKPERQEVRKNGGNKYDLI
jgi:hypothetical protein